MMARHTSTIPRAERTCPRCGAPARTRVAPTVNGRRAYKFVCEGCGNESLPFTARGLRVATNERDRLKRSADYAIRRQLNLVPQRAAEQPPEQFR